MQNLRVLVVDDEKDLVDLICLRLRGAGFSVASSCDPREGLRLVDSFKPDAILLDVSMPEMDGWEFCRRAHGKARVMIMTAWLSDDLRRRARDAGASEVVLKPFDEKEVIAALGALAEAAHR